MNQFLDAIGAQLSARGIPAAVMNWTLILDDISEFAGDSPIPPISFAQFHGAMRRFFDDGSDFAIIAHIDSREAHRLRPVLKLRFDDTVWDEISAAVNAAPPAPAAAPPESAAAALTAEQVRQIVIAERAAPGETPPRRDTRVRLRDRRPVQQADDSGPGGTPDRQELRARPGI